MGVVEPGSSVDGGQGDLEQEIEGLLLELVRGFAAHLYMARQEVEQTRAILDDAAARLMPVFLICRKTAAAEGQAAQGEGMAAELESVTRQALPAMQFHDISSQLLAHIRERFDTFLAELERLSSGIRDGADGVNTREFARRVSAMRETLAANLAALDGRLRKPVDQESMASGEAELF